MDGTLPFLDLPQPALSTGFPLIVDSFAGGGGASCGIEQALGRSPDIAINHDAKALGMHEANHPDTLHLNSNIWRVDPAEACRGRRVGLAWFSPDCKHHSRAKGGKPVARNVRDLAWVVILWAKRVRPDVIFLENVAEFREWGPLKKNDRPCPDRKGQTFDKWVNELKRLGYKVEWRELKACDLGTPTIRKRLYLIARCDGLPIVWPEQTHIDPKLGISKSLKWIPTAGIVDWSIPCPSIFMTKEQAKAWGKAHGCRPPKRPLVDATMKRIARGVMRYVVNSETPFIVPSQNGENPLLSDADHTGQIAAFMAQHNAGPKMKNAAGRPLTSPLSTLTTRGTQQQIVAVHLMNMHGSSRRMSDLRDPHPTICAGGRHGAIVAAFLNKYFGTPQDPRIDEPIHTLTTKARFGVVTVQIQGESYALTDIGMRMLTPREQFRAQGFPESYIIDRDALGNPLTITEQTRMCGNAVCPPVAKALVAANCAHLQSDQLIAA